MNTRIIIFLCSLFFVILLISFLFMKKGNENYSYNYTKLNREEVEQILKKECNLTLRDYINVLNSTDNLKLLSLQEICNNFICPELTIKDSNELMSFINTIAGKCIMKCINNKDWYRLAFVNLKVNSLMSILQNTKLVYKRALTNGVYSAEYINMYYDENQINIYDLANMYSQNYKIIKISNPDFEKYANDMLSKISNIKSDDNVLNINPIEFAMISTLSLVNIFDFPLLNC